MKKKRKINPQKLFVVISIAFITACILFYGIRFIMLYLENKNEFSDNDPTLAQIIKANNELTKIDNNYYFTGDVDNNFVMYSNMLWRIINVSETNEVKLISNGIISSLANGDTDNFKDSSIYKWLNDDVLAASLNNAGSKLVNSNICTDTFDGTSNSKCTNYDNEYKIGLLTLDEYLTIGGSNSYLNILKNFYLASYNDSNVWYVNNSGKATTSNGDDIYGVRAVITLNPTIVKTDGDGTKDNPYIIDSEGYFASYVKLDNDVWRVYKVENDTLKLVLNDYLKVDSEMLEHKYSNNNYYHNDTVNGSLAHYLNNTYLNSLSYKDVIKEIDWSNGVYGTSNNYDYNAAINTTVKTKVAMLSVGDVILNDSLCNYYLATGTSTTSSLVYTMRESGSLYAKSASNSANVVPTISIDKNLLTKGNGSINNPFEMEG